MRIWKIFTLINIDLIVCKLTVVYDDVFKKTGVYEVYDATMNGIEIQNSTLVEACGALYGQNLTGDTKLVSFVGRYRNCFKNKYQTFELGTSFNNLLHLSSIYDSPSTTLCLRYTYAFKRTVISIIMSLYLKHIAVIIDNSYCSTEFLKALSEELKVYERKDNDLIFTKLVIAGDRNIVSLYYDFYNLKTMNVNLVLLLVPSQYFHDIFKLGERFDLLESTDVWLVPDISSKYIPEKIFFSRIISFDISDSWKEVYYPKLTGIIRDIYVAMYQHESFESDIKSRIFMALADHHTPHKFNATLHDHYNDVTGKRLHYTYKAFINEKQFTLEGHESTLRSLDGYPVKKKLRIVSIIEKPFVYESLNSFDETNKVCFVSGIPCKMTVGNVTVTTCCMGFIVSIFLIVLQYTNVEVEMYIVEDGKYGSMSSNGTWNGIMADIINDKADIGVAPLTATKLRSEYVDFSHRFMQLEMGVLTKPIEDTPVFFALQYITPISDELKVVLVVVIVTMTLLNFLIENNVYFTSLIIKDLVPNLKLYPFSESMSFVGGVALQRDIGGKLPSRLGARTVAIAFSFGMVIYVTAYTAILAALSVKHQEKNPFAGSTDSRMRNPTEEFKFAIKKGTNYENFFESSDDEVYRRMGQFMTPYNVENTHEGFANVKDGSLNAYIDDYPILHWHVAEDNNCELRLTKDKLMKREYAFAVHKHHFFLEEMNHVLLHLRDYDTLEKIKTQWFVEHCLPGFFSAYQTPLGINSFGGLILTVLVTIFICLPILYLENHIKSWWDKYKDKCKLFK